MKHNFKVSIKILIINIFIFFHSSLLYSNQLDKNDINDRFAISLISINFFINNKKLTNESSFECKLFFTDDFKKKVETKNDKNSNYLILKSNFGKIYIDNLKCSTHDIPFIFGKSRYKIFDDYGFFAHEDLINYGGEINIYYYPKNFKFLDIFNFGNLSNDNGDIKIEIADKTLEFLNFVNSRFVSVNNLNIAKSIITENLKVKPNDKPFIITQEELKTANNIPINNNIEINQISNFNENKNIIIQDNPTKINENFVKTQNINNYKIETHPYKATSYSEFYSNFYNPYYSIGSPSDINNAKYSETQDLITENPH